LALSISGSHRHERFLIAGFLIAGFLIAGFFIAGFLMTGALLKALWRCMLLSLGRDHSSHPVFAVDTLKMGALARL